MPSAHLRLRVDMSKTTCRKCGNRILFNDEQLGKCRNCGEPTSESRAQPASLTSMTPKGASSASPRPRVNAAVADAIFKIIIGIVIVAFTFGGLKDKSTSSNSPDTSTFGGAQERSYQQQREHQRQEAYNTLRQHGFQPTESEQMSKTLQEMHERDQRIRSGQYRK